MNNTLASSYWPRLSSSMMLQAVTVVAGSILLAISAKVQVPFWPVPMTMQTFVVLLLGATLGPRLAGATLALYLAEGALGLPVFAKGAGLAYMAGPTGGYLAGFFLAAIVTGWLSSRGYGRSIVTTLTAFTAGEVIIFAVGAGWLATFVGLEKAIVLGVTPFLLAEVLKVGLACAVLPIAWKSALRR